MSIANRIANAWNAFRGRNAYEDYPNEYSTSFRPDRTELTGGNDRTLLTSIINRIAVDVASVDFKHVMTDENGRYIKERHSGLNNCLTVSANKDQTARAFIIDAVESLLDEGQVALVPTDTDRNPNAHDGFDIKQIRTGSIEAWTPNKVRLKVYNEATGKKEEIYMNKGAVGIIENPFYAIMNDRNSTMQRLNQKLALLDAIDAMSGSGKLDLIIQLPYTVKTEVKRKQANQRRKDIVDQLENSKYGIAYIDGTEKVTQLNRPVENHLLEQIEYLEKSVRTQLGVTEEIMNGTANESAMTNYFNRTIEPITNALIDEMNRKFLTVTARSQGQRVMFFRNHFKLIPISQLATIADTFTRNEIMTSNEFRQIVGLKPAEDPNADVLRNKNLNDPNAGMAPAVDEYGNPLVPEGYSEDDVNEYYDPYQEEY